jgi:hypothetical protein
VCIGRCEDREYHEWMIGYEIGIGFITGICAASVSYCRERMVDLRRIDA